MSSEEIASIQRAPARERGALEADESDPLVKALIRVLPITVRNILHIVSCVVRSELNPDTTSQGTIKRAMRNAIYEHHRVGDRKVALNVLQAHVSSMCVEVMDSMPARWADVQTTAMITPTPPTPLLGTALACCERHG